MCDDRGERGRDAGLTFPEVLVTVLVMAMVATVLCAALAVTLRQHDNTEGRISVAAAEQALGVYLPNDLASASTVREADGALELSWTDVETGAPVAVRYTRADDDAIARQLCVGDACRPAARVARGMPAGGWDALVNELDAAAAKHRAYRVDVALDGGGDRPGAGGGVNTVSWAATQIERGELDPNSTANAPTLANLCAAGYVEAGC